TKMHETVLHTIIKNAQLTEPKGEYVIVVDKGESVSNSLNDLPIDQHVEFYVNNGMAKMDAIKATAKDLGVSKNEVYKQLL
ncbi:MAG: 16S rRNA (cytidine(1402)-2'-O)-methyltransferase, partial [Clostridia bacterium]|nr:16S rRNA (cytidine(1402)-2'-O)-methyltransferase [Clostridia bacterium]